MNELVSGQGGSGSVEVAEVGSQAGFRLEVIRFTVATSAAGVNHHAVVELTDKSGAVIATIQDLNDAADSGSYAYTFGIGMSPSACTLPSGFAIQNDLPDTELEPGATITVRMVDDTGATIAGDTIGHVALYGFGVPPSSSGTPPADLPLLFLPEAA